MSIAGRLFGIAVGALALSGFIGASAVPAAAATSPSCATELTTVKAELKKTTAGPKLDAAKKHYKAASTAHKKNDDVTCVSELNAAEAALK
jgi:hypothetical protein